MDNPITRKSWSPYLVGAAIGVLSWFAFATADKPLGITTAFENTAALVEKAAIPNFAQTNDYYAAKAREGKSPKIDWEWMLVLGVFIGAFVSASLSGDRTKETVPEPWRSRFGGSVTKRLAAAFIGGALMMFGARLAQGCTSGHGISGALQLAVSSWVFVFVFFAVATGVALLIYGQRGAAPCLTNRRNWLSACSRASCSASSCKRGGRQSSTSSSVSFFSKTGPW